MVHKKTIAIVNAYSEIGGPDIVLKNFIENVEPENYKIILIFPCKSGFTTNFVKENVSIKILPTFPINKSLMGLALIPYLFFGFFGLIRYIIFFKKYKITLLHNNTSALIIPAIAAKICRIKIVYHVREIWNSRSPVAKFLYRFIYKVSDKIICITNQAKQRNFSTRDLNNEKFEVIYDCINLAEYTQKNVKRNDLLVISCVGRLCPIKGQDILIKASQKLIEMFPDKDIEVRVIGDIPKENRENIQYKNNLITLIDTLQINKNIKLTGFKTNIAELLSQSDILVLPSRIEEGLGVVLLEGMAAGNFVITSDIGGQKEIIDITQGGVLFENENYMDLAAKMALYLREPGTVMSITSRGLQKVRELSSQVEYGKKIIKVYTDVLN